jgi:hypothetical protein
MRKLNGQEEEPRMPRMSNLEENDSDTNYAPGIGSTFYYTAATRRWHFLRIV